jgi:hypothetical protein
MSSDFGLHINRKIIPERCECESVRWGSQRSYSHLGWKAGSQRVHQAEFDTRIIQTESDTSHRINSIKRQDNSKFSFVFSHTHHHESDFSLISCGPFTTRYILNIKSKIEIRHNLISFTTWKRTVM